jgi:hypothetical protein
MVPPLGVQRQRHALGFYGQRGTQEVYGSTLRLPKGSARA